MFPLNGHTEKLPLDFCIIRSSVGEKEFQPKRLKWQYSENSVADRPT